MQVPLSTSEPPVIRAAQYLRMSTEHQQYSLENQADRIERYASTNGMSIVRTFADGGRSGLVLSGRTGLQELLATVQGGGADFNVVLVYDVSRWGRFQDSDEGIYYEYLCKRAHIAVHFCAEMFPNDASLTTAVLKTLKRTMAAEYSRELSVKVFAGQCRLIELGFRQGGPAGFGLRRQLITQDGAPKNLLARGEQKSIHTDRVVLVPGPKEEIALVREIYDRFTRRGENQETIAQSLNDRGVRTDFHRVWTRSTVHQVLSNPKYTGANVFNRRSFKLKKQRVRNPSSMWVQRNGAFEALIGAEQFLAAQMLIEERLHRYSDEEMLTVLGGLLATAGRLSGFLIDEAAGLPSSAAYRHRFGTLARAYQMVGYTPDRDMSFVETNRVLRAMYKAECESMIRTIRGAGAAISQDFETDLLTINDEFTASMIFAACRQLSAGQYRWLLRFDASLDPDITIAARMTPGNNAVLDYYIFPKIDALASNRLRERNELDIDVYRFDDLRFFMDLTRRMHIEAA